MSRSGAITLLLLLLSPGWSIGAQEPRPLKTPPQKFFEWTKLQFPKEEYAQRRQGLVAKLREAGGGVFLAPSRGGLSSGETFRQLSDFLYFTGLEAPDSVLAIEASSGKTTLFVPGKDDRFSNPARRNDFPGRHLLLDQEIAGRSEIEDVRDVADLKESLVAWQSQGRTMLFDSRREVRGAPGAFDVITPDEALARHVSQLVPGLKIGTAHRQVALLRMVKSPAELTVMKRACAITGMSIIRAAGSICNGVTERALEGELERAFKLRGAQRRAFDSIIKSGPNSLWPWRILASHYDRRNRRMRDGELVIFDVGCEVDHYVSDVGRTFPVSGRFSPRQAELVRMVTAVSNAVIKAARPGVTLTDLQRIAMKAIPEKERRFMQASLFFGHHVGLEVGDPSLARERLQPGMTFTVEPWYYNHQEDVAVFIEDVIQITQTGSISFTAFLPRTPEALEKMVGYWKQGDGAPRANRLRVMAYNIHHGAGMDEKLDLERIALVIEREQPDVVALQEIDVGCQRTQGVDQARKLGELTGMHAVFGPFMDYGGGRYGMALLSRHPVETTWNHRLPKGPEPRTALTARIRVTGTERRFVLSSIHFYRTEEERLAQAKDLLSALDGERLPVILAGDFNSRPESPVLKHLERRFTLVAKAGNPMTFPAPEPDREIDWFMISKGAPLKIISASVIDERVASDHRPILTVLEWR